MVDEFQRRRDADEQRRDGVIATLLGDDNNRGRRLAIHEAREQREIAGLA